MFYRGLKLFLEGVEVVLGNCFSFSGELFGTAHCGEEGDFASFFFSGGFSFVFFIVCFSSFSGRGVGQDTQFFLLMFLHSFFFFKFTEVSISSGCSPSMVFFFPFFLAFWGMMKVEWLWSQLIFPRLW